MTDITMPVVRRLKDGVIIQQQDADGYKQELVVIDEHLIELTKLLISNTPKQETAPTMQIGHTIADTRFADGHFHYGLIRAIDDEADTNLLYLVIGTKAEWDKMQCLPDGGTEEEEDRWYAVAEYLRGQETCENEWHIADHTAEQVRTLLSELSDFQENKELAQFVIDCWEDETHGVVA